MIALARLPGWQNDDLVGLRDAITRQCAMRSPPPGWTAHCTDLASVGEDTGALRRWLESRFQAQPLRGARGDPVGLITGYHEPSLSGSLQRESTSQTPLYRRPADLVADGMQRLRRAPRSSATGRLAPYPTRAQIEDGALLRGQELLWLDDAVEAFFLQVQGSGRVRLRDGTMMRVGFADHNGHPYRAIGTELVQRGALQRNAVDAPRIKQWLRENPGQARSVMHSNPRYIFFRPIDTGADTGPIGALGVPLTAERSLATDPAVVPAGALLYLATRLPGRSSPYERVMLSQDRGAAIVGGVRADIFFGSDERAARLAGLMKEPGRLWMLTPVEPPAHPR